MNVITLPVQHKRQTQQPLVLQKEVASRKEVASSQQSVVGSPPPTQSSVLSPQSLSSPAPGPRPPTPLVVGRDSELTQLHRLLAKAMSGERQVVFVSGEAGIGKTTLIDAFLAQIRDRVDVRITSGQCVEQYGPGEAYMPLLEATQRLCRVPGGERHVEALHRHAPSWLAQMPSLLTAEDRHLLQQRVQGTSRERMLREMAETAELFTARRVLVVVLEDLHWSDVSTLDWIAYVARRREPAKLLIIGTYRPTEVLASGHPLRGVVQELQSRRQCEELRVTSLNEAVIVDYLRSRFAIQVQHAAPLQELAPLLYHRTGGNPLFVVNTVDYFIRHGAVTQEAGQWTLKTDKVNEVGHGIPDTLRQLIERQVERLSEAEQRLLEVASVAGVEFATADVAAGLATAVEEVEASCERFARMGQWLRSVGFVEWPDGTVSGRYSFLHAMYHEVIYARVAEIRRIQLHRRIAARKEAAHGERAGEIATELAVHFEKGREIPRAISYLERAGRTALRRSANAEVIRHLTHALTLLDGLPDSAERIRQELTLRLTLGTPLLALNGYGAPEVRQHYQEARSLCQALNDPPELFPVLWGLWLSHAVAGELSAAEELGSQLFQCAGHLGDEDLVFQAHHALWTTLVARGELTTCQSHIEQGLQRYHTDRHYAQTFVYGGHDPGACCRIHGSYLYWLLGYPDRALQLSQEALVLGKELSHGQTLAWALNGNAMVHHFRGEPQAAQQSAEEALTLSTTQQFALWAAYSPAILGWALIAQGNKEQGLEQTQAGLAALRATGTGLWQSQFMALLASAYGETGQIQEGLRVIDEALATSARNGERFYEAELYRLRGELTLQQFQVSSSKFQVEYSPRPQVQSPKSSETKSQILNPNSHAEGEAEACFHKAITIAREQEAKSWELRAATSLARLWQGQGKLSEAREQLEEVYAWFTEGFDTKDLQDAAALLSKLGGSLKTGEESQKSKIKSQKSKQEEGETAKWGNGEMGRGDRDRVIDLEPQTLDIGLRTPDSRLQSLSSPSSLQPQAYSLSQSSVPSTQHPVSDSQPSVPNTFRSEGDFWTVNFAGTTCRLKDTRGLHFIAHLLQHPHQEFHVITLITIGAVLNEEPADSLPFQDHSSLCDHTEGFGDAGEMLDPQARTAYKQRLSELREELAEAQRFHDLGRSEQLAAEIDVLTHELASAVGLGGRARRMGSPAERARVNITRAIKIALRKISEHHPALGQHLATTIKTGAYCSYTPDTRLPIRWQM